MSLLDLFVRPVGFFDEHPRALEFGSAFGVVVVAGVVSTVVLLAVGRLFATELTATVTVENPGRPPEAFCDGSVGGADSSLAGCEEPETVEKREGDLFWERWVEQLIFLPVGVLLVWVFYGVSLHVTSALVGGRGSFGRTLAVVAWGLLVTAVGAALATVALAGVLAVVSAPSDLESFVDWLQTPTVQYTSIVIGVVLSLWQGYIWYGGLVRARALEPPRAAVATAIVVILDVFWRAFA